jgi:ArsR family transcriptional regulator, arsenate/arsenite/antimonite-responsive transcriptional repressor
MPQHSVAAERLATRLGALSHPARLEILRHLAASDRCCCKEVVGRFDLAQSTVSQHLKILVEAGLVRVRTDRQRSLYEIDRTAMADIAASVAALVASWCASGDGAADRGEPDVHQHCVPKSVPAGGNSAEQGDGN